jgi:peptide methionine sulfoxide reductase msrA/msrB
MDKISSLTPELLKIIQNRETEAPFSGEYCEPKSVGTYLCRRCGLALFRAHDQFHSGCGWPSFDLEILHHVLRSVDPDGTRTEILCARCQAHLGHVFKQEGFTEKNIRHCVNSLSLDFVADETILDTEEAILAAGCFWGVEYYLKRLPGVVKTEVGYSGGRIDHPCYKEICCGSTGHLEAIRIIFDPKKLSYADLLKYFFEIHDPSQKNGQGPDLGEQYQSAIFYYNDFQKITAESVMQLLINHGLRLATSLRPIAIFWPAETYHQDYYQKTGNQPYCHRYMRRF